MADTKDTTNDTKVPPNAVPKLGIAPVNPDVNKAMLGKTAVPTPTPSTTPVSKVTETPGLGQNASVAVGNAKTGEHVVHITDFTKAAHKFYDFLIHCTTCGFENRVGNNNTTLAQATDIANKHISDKKMSLSQKVAEVNTKPLPK